MSDALVMLVSTPIGNLEDITYRAVNFLKEADIIACEDTRNTSVLLKHYDIHPKKLISLYSQTESKNSVSLIKEVKEKGLKLAYCSDAGMPGISDPGCLLVKEAIKQGVQVSVLPGASACLSALVISGFDSADFSFYGFLPSKAGTAKNFLKKLVDREETLIFYESPNRVKTILSVMSEVFGGDRQFALVRELTKMHEEVIRGKLSEASELIDEVKGECVIILNKQEGEKQIDEEKLKKEMKSLLADGQSVKEISSTLSKKYDLKKNYLYELCLKVSKC